MKRLSVAALLLLLVNYPCAAQFSWGTRTGFQYSFLHLNESNSGSAWKQTYLVPGFYFQEQLSDQTAISFDLQLANKGSRLTGQAGSKIVVPYITLPVLYHYKPSNAYSFFAGPELGLKLKSSIIQNDDRVEDNHVFVNRFDLGASVGFSIKISPQHRLMFRYTHGLINVLGPKSVIINEAGIPVNARDEGYRFTNRALQVSLTTAFEYLEGEKKANVSYNLRQGISFYSLYGRGVEWAKGPQANSNVEKRVGYEAGLEIRTDIKKYFFVTTGFNYLQKGGQIGDDPVVQMNYLTLPIILGITPIKDNRFTLSVEGGIGINKQLPSSNPYNNYQPQSYRYDPYAFTQSFIYGFELSTRIQKNVSLFFSYRNHWDGSRFFAIETTDFENYSEFYNKGESFSIGLRYHRKKKEANIEEGRSLDNAPGVGLKGGLNLTSTQYKSVPGDFSNSLTLGVGGHVGFYFKTRLGKRFGFVPEILYAKKTKYFSSVEVPAMFTMRLNQKYSIETGPQIGLLIQRKDKTIGNYIEARTVADLGWNAGMLYHVSHKLFFGLRYFHGLKDTSTIYSKDGIGVHGAGYNRTITISTFYRLSK